MPSDDAMFVTSSVRWNPADGAMWRKSLAWLDYNFALAKQNNPAYIIVASYDDPSERNSWLASDTSHCEPGRQMHDKTGALSTSAYCDRVREWIFGKPAVVPGGLVRDGAYRIFNRGHSKPLGILNTGKSNQGAPGAVLVAGAPEKAPLGLFWFYHLGSNHYRITALHSGLALGALSRNGITRIPGSVGPWHTCRMDTFGSLTKAQAKRSLSIMTLRARR